MQPFFNFETLITRKKRPERFWLLDLELETFLPPVRNLLQGKSKGDFSNDRIIYETKDVLV